MNTLDESRLEEALRGVSIPSCPAVLTELMAELRKPMANGKRVAQLIGQDVGLAALVVRSANSPLFGSGRAIGSIADAVRLLGFGTLTNLVHEGLLRSVVGTGHASLERFWDSSAHTAAVSAELAATLGGTTRDTAHTFGLFHDCGIPLLVQRFPDYKTVLGLANAAPTRCFTDIEDEALNTNHAVIGYFLTRAWGLPETVSAAILRHHHYHVLHDGEGLPDEARALIALNAIAEHVVGQYLRVRQDVEWGKSRELVAAYFGLAPGELDDLADDVLYRLDERRNREAD
jgi:putative nucleotidyltransferase with HDIG domain